MATIGLSLIVKDEPVDRLAMMVDFLKPVVSQVVILDTGSRDVEMDLPLYASWGVMTGRFEWIDDFAAARNATLPYLTTDWVLHLDADEMPTMEMIDHMKWSVEHAPAGVLGYRYLTINYWGGIKGITVPEHFHCRLFRRESGRWYKPLHEQVELDGMPEHVASACGALVKAPADAYLIHAKPREQMAVSEALYAAMEKKQ
jgi:hypothetical protein